MARLPRLIVPGEAHHIVQRTAAGSDAFPEAADYRAFIEALRRASREHGVALHAYVLTPHEVQLLATPPNEQCLSRMMQALARFYVPVFNRRHGREGALWQGRFRAAPVGGADWLLDCMRYIEQAPVRQRLQDAAPEEHEWSSAACHVGRSTDALLTQVPNGSGYWSLGNTPFERDAAYRRLLQLPLAPDRQLRIEATTVKGWALGSGEFLASMLVIPGRRPSARKPGRPPKTISDASPFVTVP